ncbi:MAG: transposase, partial [Acidimicrobiales bacterium]
IWYRHDQQKVVEALRRGERPEMATTTASGPLDELVGLHEKLGIFEILDSVDTQRQRAGIDDPLLLRTLAALPFVEQGSLSGAAGQLFGEPAVLLHLGWSPLQIVIGDNERHRRGDRRSAESLPCHVDTLRDALRRVEQQAWLRVQQLGVKALYDAHLIRGRVYAIDGTGLSNDYRLVCLVCVSAERPKIVAWRLLEGQASEKGKEAAVTRSLVEQALELGGPGTIELLLMDALYADGPLLAWLKHGQGIDALVPIPTTRELHRDMLGLTRGGLLKFRRHSYVRPVQGHKCRRSIEVAAQDGLTSWDSYIKAARDYQAEQPHLWACLIHELEPSDSKGEWWTLVSTRAWPTGVAGYEAYRPRWHIENDAYRELKEGWHLESQRWGRDSATQHGRITLICLAFNTAQVYLGRSGTRIAAQGIRRLRRHYRRELGAAPVVIYMRDTYAVLAVEQLLLLLGNSPRRSLLPFQIHPQPP